MRKYVGLDCDEAVALYRPTAILRHSGHLDVMRLAAASTRVNRFEYSSSYSSEPSSILLLQYSKLFVSGYTFFTCGGRLQSIS